MTTTTTRQYGSLREKIAAEKFERQERYDKFAKVYAMAHEAGMEAATEAEPVAMVVTGTGADGRSQSWYVPEGVCGFAWVTVRPANSSFAIWAKKTHGWRAAYSGGLQLWVSEFGQSMERKESYARAFAQVIRDELGLRCYAGSRMD